MADWIRVPFEVISGVDRGMGLLDRDGDRRRGRGTFGVNVGHPSVTNGNCDAALPKLLWPGLGVDLFTRKPFLASIVKCIYCGTAHPIRVNSKRLLSLNMINASLYQYRERKR